MTEVSGHRSRSGGRAGIEAPRPSRVLCLDINY